MVEKPPKTRRFKTNGKAERRLRNAPETHFASKLPCEGMESLPCEGRVRCVCGIAKPDRILIPEAVYDKGTLPHRFHLRDPAQGKLRMVLVHEVVDDLGR